MQTKRFKSFACSALGALLVFSVDFRAVAEGEAPDAVAAPTFSIADLAAINSAPHPSVPELAVLERLVGNWEGHESTSANEQSQIVISSRWVLGGRFVFSESKSINGETTLFRLTFTTFDPQFEVYRQWRIEPDLKQPEQLHCSQYFGQWDEASSTLTMRSDEYDQARSLVVSLHLDEKSQEWKTAIVADNGSETAGPAGDVNRMATGSEATPALSIDFGKASDELLSKSREYQSLNQGVGTWSGYELDPHLKKTPLLTHSYWTMGGRFLVTDILFGPDGFRESRMYLTTFDIHDGQFRRWNVDHDEYRNALLNFRMSHGKLDEQTGLTTVSTPRVSDGQTRVMTVRYLEENVAEWTLEFRNKDGSITRAADGTANRTSGRNIRIGTQGP